MASAQVQRIAGAVALASDAGDVTAHFDELMATSSASFAASFAAAERRGAAGETAAGNGAEMPAAVEEAAALGARSAATRSQRARERLATRTRLVARFSQSERRVARSRNE